MDTLSAVLFDVDGTLVDSNYVHIAAWSRALADLGHPVDSWRIHRAIGMDSKKLLVAVLGELAAEFGERAKELHRRYFLEASGQLRPFAGATDLLRELAQRGLRVVLATSAPADELAALRAALGAEQAVTAVTSASDVATAKPDPDIVEAALREAGVAAAQAVMVGDAVWDIEAAARVGVRCISLLSGGTGALELREARAIEVFADPADLLANLAISRLSG